jgi:hypothetical protein
VEAPLKGVELRLVVLAATAACCLAAAGAASAAVPPSIQGTFKRQFGIQDFKQAEEAPSGNYTMKITSNLLVWTAGGLGQPIEQIKVTNGTLEVRDKPGSLGRLCATEAWGTYRFKASGKSVTFTKVKDPCTTRADILGKTWTK